MDYLKEHREILEKAIADQLPEEINRHSEIAVAIFHELYEEGFVAGIDVSSSNEGIAYLEPRITVKGREYLNELNKRREEASLSGRAKKLGLLFVGWIAGIASSVIVALVGKFL